MRNEDPTVSLKCFVQADWQNCGLLAVFLVFLSDKVLKAGFFQHSLCFSSFLRHTKNDRVLTECFPHNFSIWKDIRRQAYFSTLLDFSSMSNHISRPKYLPQQHSSGCWHFSRSRPNIRSLFLNQRCRHSMLLCQFIAMVSKFQSGHIILQLIKFSSVMVGQNRQHMVVYMEFTQIMLR